VADFDWVEHPYRGPLPAGQIISFQQLSLTTGWEMGVEKEHPLPVKTFLVWVKPDQAQLSVEPIGTRQYLWNGPEWQERMDDGQPRRIYQPPREGSSWFHIRSVKTIGGKTLWAVTLFGALVGENKQVWLAESIRVRLKTGISNFQPIPAYVQPEGLKSFLLNPLPEQAPPVPEGTGTMGQGVGKIIVDEDGIYQVGYDSLYAAGMISQPVPSSQVALFSRGEAVPIFVEDHGDGYFGPGDYLQFIGKRNRPTDSTRYYDPYSDLNVYWLGLDGGGRRFVEESGLPGSDQVFQATHFREKLHLEEDLVFDRLGQVDTYQPTFVRDHLFWGQINSGGTLELSFSLPSPDFSSPNRVQIRIGLHGLAYREDPQNPMEHSLFAFINGNSVGSVSWTQQTETVLTSPPELNLSNSLFHGGTEPNMLSLFVPTATEPDRYDRVVINWMEVEYDRLLRAEDDFLIFRKSELNPAGMIQFEITGLTSPEVTLLKEGVSRIRDFSLVYHPEQGNTYSLIFQDVADEATPDFWLAAGEAIKSPLRLEPDTLAGLRQGSGDFIIIAPRRFTDLLEEFKQFKENLGWTPFIACLTDIYDEFNYGINSPLAIKRFLRYAWSHWQPRPSYVLLVGAPAPSFALARRDTFNKYLPTFFIQTYRFGASEADYWYGLLEGDDLFPEMHVGRLPVDDTEELLTVLGKIMDYERGENPGLWQNQLVTIAGFENTFKYQSQELIHNVIPDRFLVQRLFIDRDSEGQVYWGDTDTLKAAWNEGRLLINFMGHGGGAVWADRSLLTNEDIPFLRNEALPVVTSMTCFTGSFALNRGLGKTALVSTANGAVSWFGSTGVGWIINDYLLIRPILRRLLNTDRPLGAILDEGKTAYYLAANGYDYLKPTMLYQYALLGDPTLRLARPHSTTELSLPGDYLSPGSSLVLAVPSALNGELAFQFWDGTPEPIWQHPRLFQVQGGEQIELIVPSFPNSTQGSLVYAIHDYQSGEVSQGKLDFGLASEWLEHAAPADTEWLVGDSISLTVEFHGARQPDSIVCAFSGDSTGVKALRWDGNTWYLTPPLRVYWAQAPVGYQFRAYHHDTLAVSSRWYYLHFPPPPQWNLTHARWGHLDRTAGVWLGYTSSGASGLAARVLLAWAGSDSGQVEKTITLKSGQDSLFVPLLADTASLELRVQGYLAIEVNTYTELITSVLPNEFQVIPNIGLTFDGSKRDTLGVWQGWLTVSPPADSGWLHFEPVSTVPPSSGISLVLHRGAYDVRWSENLRPYVVWEDTSETVFCYGLKAPTWSKIFRNSSRLLLKSSGGIFATGKILDHTPPEVEFTILGQRFFDGGYLDRQTTFNLVARDPSGFEWDTSAVRFLLDGEAVAVTLGDTTPQGHLLSVEIPAELTPGEHDFSFQVRDALGNWSALEEYTGVVTSAPEIIDYGNFPNPFQARCLIIYELTRPLDQVSIDIYSLGGHKILSITDDNAAVDLPLGGIGYHEIPWDGRDAHGEFVANGVYFYVVRGQYEGRSLRGNLIKMAKSR